MTSNYSLPWVCVLMQQKIIFVYSINLGAICGEFYTGTLLSELRILCRLQGERHDSGSGIIFHKKSIGLHVILYPRLLKFWWLDMFYSILLWFIICSSRAAGSRKRLYLRRRYILEGRKNPMLSVVSYICVGYHPGGCRFSKWCKFFLEPKRWRGP